MTSPDIEPLGQGPEPDDAPRVDDEGHDLDDWRNRPLSRRERSVVNKALHRGQEPDPAALAAARAADDDPRLPNRRALRFATPAEREELAAEVAEIDVMVARAREVLARRTGR
jgi:hypothetical protein